MPKIYERIKLVNSSVKELRKYGYVYISYEMLLYFVTIALYIPGTTMAKTDPKKTKSPAKSKGKSPLKKVTKPKAVAKRAGVSKKVAPKKVVKANLVKKTPSKKIKPSTAKVKKHVVKTKAAVKPKAKATKKSTAKPRSKSPSKPTKKPLKKDTKKVTKKKAASPKTKKPKSAASKKQALKKDSKKKPTTKKVVSTKKKKTPVKKTATKKPVVKKPKTVKKATKSIPVKKKAVVTKKPKQAAKGKPKPQKQKSKQIKALTTKSGKSNKKVTVEKKVVKVSITAKQKKSKLSAVRLKASKLKTTKRPGKAPKKVPKATKQTKSKAKTPTKKTQKKQAIKSKTLTAGQKEKLKKVKAVKKLKAAKTAATTKKSKGKENKEPTKKRKALEKDSGKAVKKIKLTGKDKDKSVKKVVNKVQKQKLKVSIQKKKAKEHKEKRSPKKLALGVKKQKKEQKSPLKQNKAALLKQNKAIKPKQTTPKKKAKSIDDIGNWSPTIPVTSTASPVWGYTPPGNFGKKSMFVHGEQLAEENKKQNNANPSKIKIVSGTSFNIRIPEDDKKVWITGMAVFQNGQIIMCDIQNVNLKLFDATSHQLLSFVRTGRLPQDISISALNPTDAYFTLNMEKAIQKCSVVDKRIVLGEKFSVNGCCRGIVCTTNGIVTSVESPAFLGYQIQVRDYDGTIMRTISNMQSGLFSHPICFDITSDGDKIVISDCALMSATICLDINGKQIYKFTRIPRQRGITLDERNNVYLPDHSNTNKLIVMLLSADGREVKDLITKGTKGVKENLTKPYQIVYHRLDGIPMLFLSVQENDTMYAFKLSN